MKTYKFLVKTSFGNEFTTGEYNGYVIIPQEHPYYAKSYWDINDIDIHGGLTLSEPLSVFPENVIEWIGEKPEILENYWVFGFDTCHLGDNKDNWNKKSVIKEVEQLEKQLLEIYEK
jgi:hypothetical protein